jgi:hypothetical protein
MAKKKKRLPRTRKTAKTIRKRKDPETCPYCGEEIGEDRNLSLLTCPECGRDGCCKPREGVAGCMPGGRNCICPECEYGPEEE